jgi:predicted DNA-binding WGR domain protein
MKIRLEYVGGGSSKFWQVTQTGANLAVVFGRIGTAGQTQHRAFDSAELARADAEKQAAAKRNKGYRDGKAVRVKSVKAAGVAAEAHPFLFVGQGLGSSYKSLECYAWFKQAPAPAVQAKIKAALPPPVTAFVKFHGDLMHFGCDDQIEIAVKAAYEPDHASKPYKRAWRDVYAIAKAGDFDDGLLFPAKRTWKAFCDDFERRMLEVHRVAKLELVLKPDASDGDLDLRPGAWHRRSVLESHRFAEHALATGRKPTSAAAYLTVNLVAEFEDSVPARLAPSARKTWLAWLDRLAAAGPKDLLEDFEEIALVFLDTFKAAEQRTILSSLSKRMQAALANQLDG